MSWIKGFAWFVFFVLVVGIMGLIWWFFPELIVIRFPELVVE